MTKQPQFSSLLPARQAFKAQGNEHAAMAPWLRSVLLTVLLPLLLEQRPAVEASMGCHLASPGLFAGWPLVHPLN